MCPSPAPKSIPSGVVSGRLVTTDFVKDVCDLADKFCDGFLRFTSRNNIEFLLSDQSKIAGVEGRLQKGWASPSAAPATR